MQLYQRWPIPISITDDDPVRYDGLGSYFSQGLLQGRRGQSIQDIIKNNFLAAKELSGTNAGRLCNSPLQHFPCCFSCSKNQIVIFFFYLQRNGREIKSLLNTVLILCICVMWIISNNCRQEGNAYINILTINKWEVTVDTLLAAPHISEQHCYS